MMLSYYISDKIIAVAAISAAINKDRSGHLSEPVIDHTIAASPITTPIAARPSVQPIAKPKPCRTELPLV
jgi:hypothetical protein